VVETITWATLQNNLEKKNNLTFSLFDFLLVHRFFPSLLTTNCYKGVSTFKILCMMKLVPNLISLGFNNFKLDSFAK